MEKPLVTYIVTPICDAFIARFVYTLYKFSEPGSFRLIVIDQCENQFRKEVMDYVLPLCHLYIHPKHNLGYAKAMNEGVIHAIRWGTPYICCSNDDIEIMDSRWIDGIYETFEMDERIGAVVPMSSRAAGWGYGVSYNPEIIPYKKEYTKEDYDFLLKGDFTKVEGLPPTMPKQMGGTVVDGAVFIMTYFKRSVILDVGLMDERYWPGSGEDVDWNARAYQKGYRVVSTSKSWIFHAWSKSKDLFASGELERAYYKPTNKTYWNNEGDLWSEGFDVWGKDKEGNLYPRVPEIFVDQINF